MLGDSIFVDNVTTCINCSYLLLQLTQFTELLNAAATQEAPTEEKDPGSVRLEDLYPILIPEDKAAYQTRLQVQTASPGFCL